LDTRFESYRLRDDAGEARLLASIASSGIEEPLEGVDTGQRRLLLNGFKRNRCAKRLGLELVPYVCLSDDQAMGIACLLRRTRDKSLCILEQAKFVLELMTVQGMTLADTAEMLSRSKAWVSMRHGLAQEISPSTQQILLRGRFPVYCYMYKLRPFMRMNGVGQQEIERFITAVSGYELSVREIELLADGYFRGPASLRAAIDEGKWKWSLEQMQAVPEDPDGCNPVEFALLKDLEQLLKKMQRVMSGCNHDRLQTRTFHVQAQLLVAGILCRQESFFKTMEEFYDRSGNT
jgi:hypothetical protein